MGGKVINLLGLLRVPIKCDRRGYCKPPPGTVGFQVPGVSRINVYRTVGLILFKTVRYRNTIICACTQHYFIVALLSRYPVRPSDPRYFKGSENRKIRVERSWHGQFMATGKRGRHKIFATLRRAPRGPRASRSPQTATPHRTVIVFYYYSFRIERHNKSSDSEKTINLIFRPVFRVHAIIFQLQ